VPDPSLVRFRAVVRGALAQLEGRRQEVNDLNVFPVADGDTGDNMVLTLRAVLDELDRLARDDRRSLDEIGRDEIVASVARAALLGARGNSGVILSQLIRGAAEELVSRPGQLVDPALVGAAMARAADAAYDSVREPAEGTILTVMREMAHRVASELAHMSCAELSPGAPAREQDELIADVLERAVQSGQASVKRGPELLEVLRAAGVVDAGGYGLVVALAGVVAALRGSDPPEVEHPPPAARATQPHHSSATFRYCTNFAVTGRDLDASRFRRALERLGDSVLVVGDRLTLKVHLHTDDPAAAAALFDGHGTVSHLDVADMREQESERLARLTRREDMPRRACGALAVVSGPGMRELFAGLGVGTVDGGPTLNPSTYDVLAGIHAVDAESVIVLANSPNVVMAAERAAALADRPAAVVPTRSQQAGLAVAVALETHRGLEANLAAMREALAHVRTGAVAAAARDDGLGRFRAGEAVGFVEDELVAWGAPRDTLEAVLDRLGEDAELLTCIEGEEAPLDAGAVAALAPEGVEVEHSVGGQPSWWWLLSAE
jgi:DAK2 domain fusion protein YloV